MRRFYTVTLFLLFYSVATIHAQDTISIACYNLLNYPGSTDLLRNPGFRTVISALHPDILVCEEVNEAVAANEFRDSVMKMVDTLYNMGTWINCQSNASENENVVFYRKDKFTFLYNTPILTDLRDINRFSFVHINTGIPFSLFGVHLKAGNAASDITRKTQEADSLRKYTNALPFGSNLVVCGDFNFYTSSESGYTKLLSDNITYDGEFYDPVTTMTGVWNNPAYAIYHTQSTRKSEVFFGGATSGLDDRFDLILHSQAIKDPGGMDYIPGSLKAFGNDGNHFNDSIKAQPNTAVSPAVADALYYVSDHLPVIEKFKFSPVILPVELSSFYAVCNNGITEIVWTTESESNSQQFILEASIGNSGWQTVDSMPASINSSLHNEYKLELPNLPEGINYFRLKMVDTDNSYVYSNTIAVNCMNPQHYLLVYPNPFNSLLNLTTNIPESELIIRDMLGRTYNYSATLIQTLPSGVYILFSTDNSVPPVKIIKE